MSDQALMELVYRYGEICVAGGTDHRQAVQLAERIQAEIRRRRYRLNRMGVLTI